MRVSFYGTRGTVPVSGGDYKQTGGGTSCVVVRGAGRDVVLDAGSGLLDYGRELMERFTSEGDKPVTDMLFSHAHLDHLVGLPSFGPLFMPGAKVRMWGPRTPQHDSFQETVESLVHPPYFPIPMYEMSADIEIFDLMGRETLYLADQSDEALHVRVPSDHDDHERAPSPEAVGLKIDVMRGHNHPKTGVNHYRIEGEDRAVVYATDTEGFRCGDRRLIEFAESADVLIHDAMFSEAQYTEMPNPTQGYGHATPVDAARVADKAGVERLVLFHHSPTSSDDDLNGLESDAREIFPESVLARDGMTLEV